MKGLQLRQRASNLSQTRWDGQFRGADGNLLAANSYLAVVAKEKRKEGKDEAMRGLRNSLLQVLGAV